MCDLGGCENQFPYRQIITWSEWVLAHFSNIDAREVGFGLLNGRDDGDVICLGLVKISKLLITQDDFFHGMMLLDRE